MRSKYLIITLMIIATTIGLTNLLGTVRVFPPNQMHWSPSATGEYVGLGNVVGQCFSHAGQVDQNCMNGLSAKAVDVYTTGEVDQKLSSTQTQLQQQIQTLAPAIVQAINQATAKGSLTDAQIASVTDTVRQRLAAEFSDRLNQVEAQNASFRQQLADLQKQITALQNH